MAIIPLTKTLVAAIATGAYDESPLAAWTRRMALSRRNGIRRAIAQSERAIETAARVVAAREPS